MALAPGRVAGEERDRPAGRRRPSVAPVRGDRGAAGLRDGPALSKIPTDHWEQTFPGGLEPAGGCDPPAGPSIYAESAASPIPRRVDSGRD